MKKAIVAGLLSVVLMSMPAYADESDLLSRIEALEERVTQLEMLLSGTEETSQPVQASGEIITLDTGTWIVGEDIAAGKYNITCPAGQVSVMLYDNYEVRKENEYSAFERYDLASQAYHDQMKGILGETVDSILSLQANNVRLTDGNCIFTEGTATFTPVQ